MISSRIENQNTTQEPQEEARMVTRDLNLYYGPKHALKNINTSLTANAITALIGPSGCGKSTFLRCLNRMNDLIESVSITGEVLLD
jgi:phosphate transport system ATP-binding protein